MEIPSKETTAPLEPMGSIIEAPVAAMNTDYERFRLVRPNEYTVMCDSMKYYGQINPATAGQAMGEKNRYDLIDGFKRYRACIKLEIPTLKIRLLRGSAQVMKAAILTLNGSQRTLHAFEEALLVRSLFYDDGLNQVQIAALFDRHKSWSCRRMALCERSCEEILEHIRLGLIGFAAARELWRLPRGNQAKALVCAKAPAQQPGDGSTCRPACAGSPLGT
jgi:phage-related protein